MNSPFKTNTINWKLQTLIQIRTSMFLQVPHTLRQELAAYKATLNPANPQVEPVVEAQPAAQVEAQVEATSTVEPTAEPPAQPEAKVEEVVAQTTTVPEPTPVAAVETPAPLAIEQPKAKEKPAKSAEEEEAEAREKLSLDALIARIEKFKAKMAANTPAPAEPTPAPAHAPVEVAIAETPQVETPVEVAPIVETATPVTATVEAEAEAVAEAVASVSQPVVAEHPAPEAPVAVAATVATESMKRFVMPEFGGSVHATGAVPDFAASPAKTEIATTQPEATATQEPSAEVAPEPIISATATQPTAETIATESMRRYVPLELEGEVSKPRNNILGEPTFPSAKKYKAEGEEQQAPSSPGETLQTNEAPIAAAGEATLVAQTEGTSEPAAESSASTAPVASSAPKPGVLDVIASEERLQAQTDSMKRFVLPDFGAVDPTPFPRLERVPEQEANIAAAAESAPVAEVAPEVSEAPSIRTGEVVAKANTKEFIVPEFGNLEQTVRLPKGAPVTSDSAASDAASSGTEQAPPAYNPPGPATFQISAQTESLRRFVMPDFGVQAGTSHLEYKPSFVEGAAEPSPVTLQTETTPADATVAESVAQAPEELVEATLSTVNQETAVPEVTAEVAMAEALTAEHASEIAVPTQETAPETLESMGLSIAAETGASQPATVSLANLGELRISEVSLKMEVENGKLKLVLDLPQAALNELGNLLGVKQNVQVAPPPAEPARISTEAEVQQQTEEAPTAPVATEQMSESITQLDTRITHFRQNLERIRAKGMAHPTDSTIQAIQRRYLDRIIEGMAPLQTVGMVNAPSYVVESLLEQPITRETSELDNLIAKVESFTQNRPLPESGILDGVELNETASIDELDPDLLTETLAEIHLQQGKRAEAIRVFEKLQLKFPDKSSYFATRISEILKQS